MRSMIWVWLNLWIKKIKYQINIPNIKINLQTKIKNHLIKNDSEFFSLTTKWNNKVVNKVDRKPDN